MYNLRDELLDVWCREEEVGEEGDEEAEGERGQGRLRREGYFH